jgi:hypothetical protein
MKLSVISKILILSTLSASPAFAINKCTSKWSVSYQQSACPKDAIKSEPYVDKVGAPERNPLPRYRHQGNEETQQMTTEKIVKNSKSNRKTMTD